jgi:hypothetical protein
VSRLRFLALLVPAWLLAACGSSESVRYKMTVEVDTPEGLKIGSAVRESTYETPPSLPAIGEDRGRITVKGEAVAVDLPNGQTLFALLSSATHDVDYAARIPDRMMALGKGRVITRQPVTIWPPAHPEGVPMLVRFVDIADPKTVEVIEPDALEKSFGPNYRLKRIEVQLTQEPITIGIGERLRWLGPYPEPSLIAPQGLHDWSPAARVRHGDFRRGTMK